MEGGALLAGAASSTAGLRERVCDRTTERVSVAHFRRLDDAWLSSIGVPAAALLADDAELSRLLDLGLNVIDVDLGRPEQGRAVRAALATGADRRQELFLIAHGGVLGVLGGVERLGERLARIERELVAPGVIAWEDLANDRCIAPAYLKREIAAARAALGVATIDGYLLEQPHLLLERRPAPERAGRLAAAFDALEREVRAGAIGCYGLSVDAGAAPTVTVAGALQTAHQVAGDGHHLKMVHLPASFGALDPRTGIDAAWPVQAARDASALGLYVVTRSSVLRGVGALPFHLRNELPALESEEDRLLQLCRSAPGVGTTIATPRDGAGIEEVARIARTPPVTEAAGYLLVEDPALET